MATSITGTGITFPDTTTQTTAGTQSLATSGYQKLPSGMIIQWGYISPGSVTTGTITYPLAFPTAAASILLNRQSAAANTYAPIVTAYSNTSFNWDNPNYSPLFWIAIGY